MKMSANSNESQGAVVCCPRCKNEDILELEQWRAQSLLPEDSENVATLTEYVCLNEDCGECFWV